MRIATLTCSKHPNGVTEDTPLFQALSHHGMEHHICLWDQPNDWAQFDVLLLRSVWDYHERKAEFLNWCQERSKETLLLNPFKVIQWNSNKLYLKALSDAGLPIAPTQWFSLNDDIQLGQSCQQLGGDQWFLKPVVGADSSGTLRFDSSQFQEAQNHLKSHLPDMDMMLQPYLSSVESHGEVSLIFFGKHCSHAVIKKPVAGDYRVQDTFGASDHLHQPTPTEMAVSRAVIEHIHDRFEGLCYARIDLLHDDKGQPLVNEVELIEPSLFLHHAPQKSINQFIQVINQSFNQSLNATS